MSNELLKKSLNGAFEEFVDSRIDDVLGSMRETPLSGYTKRYSEFEQQSRQLRKNLIDLLSTLGPEARKLLSDYESAEQSVVSVTYDAIYRQAFNDGQSCKDINTIWKDVICNDQNKAS